MGVFPRRRDTRAWMSLDPDSGGQDGNSPSGGAEPPGGLPSNLEGTMLLLGASLHLLHLQEDHLLL